MAERGLEPAPAAVAALPPEVRAQLAELELELSEGRSRAGGASARAPLRIAATGRAGPRRAPCWPCGRDGRRVPEIWPVLRRVVFPALAPHEVGFLRRSLCSLGRG